MTVDTKDQALAREFATRGAEDAFRLLLERHASMVYSTAVRQLGDHGLAQDVTQAVFFDLARKAGRIASYGTLAGWLHRATLLEAKSQMRAHLRRKERELAAVSLAANDDPPSASNPLLPLLDEGLSDLRDADREALVLRYLEGKSLREVGSALGVAEEAARKRVDRALEKLASFFKARGFALPCASAAVVAAFAAVPVEAAPAALTAQIAASAAAVSAPASISTIILIKTMALTKIQTAAICGVLAVGTIAWSRRDLAAVETQAAQAAVELQAARAEMASLETEVTKAGRDLEQSGAARLTAEARASNAIASASAWRTPKASKYAWDEKRNLLRVPKELIDKLHLETVTDFKGTLNPAALRAMQATAQEQQALQEALERFLQSYSNLARTRMKQVDAEPGELDGRPKGDVRVFVMPDLKVEMRALQENFFAEAQAIIGSQRLKTFKEGFNNWMPLDDEYSGINTGMAIHKGEQRWKFRAPGPDNSNMKVSMKRDDGSSFSMSLEPENVPYMFREALADWIALSADRKQASSIVKP